MFRLVKLPATLFNHIANYLILKKNKVKHGAYRFKGLVHLNNKGTCILGEGVKINSGKFTNPIGGDVRTVIIVKPGATFQIGDNTGISNSTFVCRVGITIGKNVLIGGSCKVWDTDFHPLDPDLRLQDPNANYVNKPIVIEDNAFIGSGCYILKGVTIGANAVVGAGSVVARNIPANEIWAGNPARFIRKVKKDA